MSPAPHDMPRNSAANFLSSATATAHLVATAQKRQRDMIQRQRAHGPPPYSYYSSQKRRRLDQREEESEGEPASESDEESSTAATPQAPAAPLSPDRNQPGSKWMRSCPRASQGEG